MANIKTHLSNIKNALFGNEVRGSIHDGIDAINKEVESTTGRQEHLETTFDQLTINAGNSNAEIVDARVGENGKSYAKLGDRLDSVDSQLEHKPNKNEVRLKNIELDLNDFNESSRSAIAGGDYNLNYILGKENVKPYNTVFFDHINLFDGVVFTDNKYILWQSGELGSNESYKCSDFIEIQPNTVYYWQGFNATHLALYNSDKQYISNDFYAKPLTNPFNSGSAKYIRVSKLKSDSTDLVLKDVPLNIQETLKEKYIPKTDIDFNQLAFTVKSKNLFNKDDANNVIGKYVLYTSGQLMNNDSYIASDFIEIKPSTKYTRTYATQMAFYDNDKIYISGDNSNKTVTSPSNAKYARLSILKSTLDTYQFEEGENETSYQTFGSRIPQDLIEKDSDVTYLVNKFNKLVANKKGYQEASTDSLNTGEILKINELNCVKKNKTINFNANITSLDKIKLGQGETDYNGSYIIIDSTNISIYNYATSEQSIKQVAHGLNLTDFINVNIKIDNKTNAKIIVVTSNGMFETTVEGFQGCNGNVFARVINGSITDCKLSHSSEDYKKDIYMYGDSYFGLYSDYRWPKYLIDNEYDKNVLLDAFSGRNTATALNSFNNTIKYGTPKIAVWCMGMNDADSSTEINNSWLSATQSFISKCIENNIVPILATIPNVPTRNHSFKNEWVRNSGYRYIDFNKSVGADKSVDWYDNMLSSDKVHPNVLGAKALFMQVLTDLPELRE